MLSMAGATSYLRKGDSGLSRITVPKSSERASDGERDAGMEGEGDRKKQWRKHQKATSRAETERERERASFQPKLRKANDKATV